MRETFWETFLKVVHIGEDSMDTKLKINVESIPGTKGMMDGGKDKDPYLSTSKDQWSNPLF